MDLVFEPTIEQGQDQRGYYLFEILDIIDLGDQEISEIRHHSMAATVLLKDIYRIQLAEIFKKLIENRLHSIESELTAQLDLFGGNISPLLRILQILKDPSVDRSSPEYINLIGILQSAANELKNVLSNWGDAAPSEFIDSAINTSKAYLEENIMTFLGENLVVRDSMIDSLSGLEASDKAALSTLVSENGFRKIEFGYELDLDKLVYLINSAFRCRNILTNEREDAEFFNLLTLLQIKFGETVEAKHIFREIKTFFSSRIDLVKKIEEIEAISDSPAYIIETSPPIYKKVQKNLMFRIYENTPTGYQVHIFSLPYNQDEVNESLSEFSSDFTMFNSFNSTDSANIPLSNLFFANTDGLAEILAKHPTISRLGLKAIMLNDSLLGPILRDSLDLFTDLIDENCNDLHNVVRDPIRLRQFVEKYESRVRALDLKFKDKSKIKVENLTSEQLDEIQAKISTLVEGGLSFEDAVKEIVGDQDFALESSSEGPCVEFETNVRGSSTSDDSPINLELIADGTVVETKQSTRNGLTAKTRKIKEGDKLNTYITCLVCGTEFDICAPQCTNTQCNTPREIQYNAWHDGKEKDKAELERYKEMFYDNAVVNEDNMFGDNFTEIPEQEQAPGVFDNIIISLIEGLTFGMVKVAQDES